MTPVLIAVDDLLFASKINAAARQIGLETVYARSQDEILSRARELNPPLVIFDLNSARCSPVAAIAALKADPALKRIRSVGFLSHVQVDLKRAAEQAGCDQVMPRSAFTQQLADILQSARP